MGHKNPATLLRIYAHVLGEQQEIAALKHLESVSAVRAEYARTHVDANIRAAIYSNGGNENGRQDALRADPEPNILTFSAPYFGYPFASATDITKASEFSTAMMPMHGLYRWHLPDPIYFQDRLRVTVQQIGTWEHGLFERSDDISTTAYWYQTTINAAFPPLPPAQHRTPR